MSNRLVESTVNAILSFNQQGVNVQGVSFGTPGSFRTIDEDVKAMAIGPTSIASHYIVIPGNMPPETPIIMGVDSPFVGDDHGLVLARPVVIKPYHIQGANSLVHTAIDVLYYSKVPFMPMNTKRAPIQYFKGGLPGFNDANGVTLPVFGRKRIIVYIDNTGNAAVVQASYLFQYATSSSNLAGQLQGLADTIPAGGTFTREIAINNFTSGMCEAFQLSLNSGATRSYKVEAYD